MPSIVFSLVFLFLTNFFIEPAKSDIYNYVQNLELDDVTSLVDKFPMIISKMKDAGMLFKKDTKNAHMKVIDVFEGRSCINTSGEILLRLLIQG